MKKYKLLKDLPVAKAGTIFWLNDDGHLRADMLHDYEDVIVYSKSDLEKFPNILTDWFEEIKETTRWKPEIDQKYYCMVDSGPVVDDYWNDVGIDHSRFEIGNCFQTEEEAKRVVEYLKALAVVRGDATTKFVEGNKNWFVYYRAGDNSLYTDFCYYYTRNGIFGLPYFATERDAQRSIKLHKNEWLTIFGVKDEE